MWSSILQPNQEFLPLLQTYSIDLSEDVVHYCSQSGIDPQYHSRFAKKVILVAVNIVNMKVYNENEQLGLCLGSRFSPVVILTFVKKILQAIANLYAGVDKNLKCQAGLGFGDHLVCAQSLADRPQIVCYDLYNAEFTRTYFHDPATGDMHTQRAMLF